MADDPSKVKWHEIDSTAAKSLTDQTCTPGLVYPVPPDAIPPQLKCIPGAVEFYVSSYVMPIPLTSGLDARGEIAVVRHEGGIAKGYNWIFATSANGKVYFSVLHKDFPSHHFETSTYVPVEKLFGHPLTKGKT